MRCDVHQQTVETNTHHGMPAGETQAPGGLQQGPRRPLAVEYFFENDHQQQAAQRNRGYANAEPGMFSNEQKIGNEKKIGRYKEAMRAQESEGFHKPVVCFIGKGLQPGKYIQVQQFVPAHSGSYGENQGCHRACECHHGYQQFAGYEGGSSPESPLPHGCMFANNMRA